MSPKKADAATPLMQQYLEIKSHHRDAILFFRMGDFYEMFYEDAEIAARDLGLTLTTRNNGGAARVPLAGVPVKSGSEYLRRLVEKGHRVAVCEQVEDPKLAKGVVKREVVETLTPGSVIDDDWLDSNRNNFLVAVHHPKTGLSGVAALDMSTGEFVIESVATENVTDILQRYDPREVVVAEGSGIGPGQPALVTERETWEFDPDMAVDELTRRFNLAGLDGLGVGAGERAAVGAAGALLRYADQLRPGGLPQLSRPVVRQNGGTVLLDEMTSRNLELVESLRGDDSLTLLRVLDRTRTPMGSRLLRQWLLAPLKDCSRIVERHQAVEVFVQNRDARTELRETLGPVRDLERLAGRCAAGRATPRDLGALRDSLAALPAVESTVQRVKGCPALEHNLQGLDLLTDLRSELADHLSDDPPVTFGSSESIRSGADSELDDARQLRDGGKEFIAGIQQRERERTGIQSLKVGYNKVFGYYIEVSKANKAAVPDDYDRRQTLTNAERYITPELKEYEAKVLGAEERVDVRERQLIEQLRDFAAARIDRLKSTGRSLAELDVFTNLAEVAEAEDLVRPEMSEDFQLDLRECRHPVVEQMLPRGKFIPNDVVLDASSRVMLLTGPNMAGKSTILRQVGLAVAMAQMGSFVPAASARIGVTDRIFTRVGASDNLVRGQSTFMVEMAETSAILHGATAASLVLLDEIGRGTSTYDGVAIAWSVTEHLHDRIGCKTIFATHYHELTQLTEELQHAVNFNVAVRETKDRIIFLHRLQPGGTDRSYGIHVAKLAGLPERVVDRAWEILRILEAQHRVVDIEAPAPPDQRQLPLFESDSRLREGLKSLNPDSMTPLDALNALADLKKIAEED